MGAARAQPKPGEAARRAGFIRWQEAEHVIHCYWGGRWDEALATADKFIRETEAGSSHYMEGICRGVRAAIWLARGQTQAVLAEAHRGTELSRAVKDSQSLNPLLAFESRAALALGDRAAANALADELVEAWRSIGIRQPDECTNAPWVFRDLARADELREALERETGTFPWHEAARRVISDDLAGAADVYAEIGSVPDEAYTRLRAAEELVRAGGSGRGGPGSSGWRSRVPAELGAAAWTAEAEKLLAASA